MDRVLRLIFARLIGAGNLRVTTAGGSTFIFGDGTGTPAAIRFTTRAAQGRVLLIAGGGGGLARSLPELGGARVTGITLWRRQLARARGRAEEKGLADKVEFRLQDYGDVPKKFDRIFSVGMFEHVGVGFYAAF